jgi:hypothetical protein
MGRHRSLFTTYAGADAFLGTKDRRPIPGLRATDVRRTGPGTIALRYQATDVVTYRADGCILNSGGWRTATTKQRFADFSPARVYADRGIWRLAGGLRYEDGILVDEDGQPGDTSRHVLHAAEDARTATERAIDRAVSRYIREYAARVTAGELEDPSGGDCWACLMHKADETPGPATRTGNSWSRGTMPAPHGRTEVLGLDHYFGHVREGYHVPSLLANAIRCAGYGDPGYVWHRVTRGRDGRWARTILSGYFRRLKPALYDYAHAHGGRAVLDKRED